MDSFIGSLIEIGLLAAVGLIGAIFMRKDFRVSWFIGALVIALIYNALLTRGFRLIPVLIPGGWNWTGKLLSLAATLAIMSLPGLGWKRCGFTLDQGKHWRWPLGVLVVLCGVLLCGILIARAISWWDGTDDLETIAFQWTMPGFDEELYYRGTLLLLLNEAFRPKVTVLGAPIGYGGLLTTFAFGLAHAVSYKAGVVDFEWMQFAVTGFPALFLLWMRERTGSLLMPVFAHNYINGIFTLF